MGNAFRGLQRHDQAISFWKRYLLCKPGDTLVMVRLADSYRRQDRMHEAEQLYRKALAMGGNELYANLGLGNLCYKKGDDDTALECFEFYLSINGGNVAVLTMMGNIHQRHKRFEDALRYYKRTLVYDANNPFALYGMGNCYRGMQQLDQAIECWLRVLNLEPENQNLYTRVGDACLVLGRFEEAERYYHRSLRIGFDLYAHLGLAKAYLSDEKFDEAEMECRTILERMPDNRRALLTMVAVCEARGDISTAEQIKEKLVLSA